MVTFFSAAARPRTRWPAAAATFNMQADGYQMPTEIIIAGFHRSGTSLAAQLLHEAGLSMGQDLLRAAPSNPYGHFEDREFVDLHGNILKDNGLNWQVSSPLIPHIAPQRWAAARELVKRRRLEHRVWGFKDPRVCLFAGFWKHLMPAARILVVFRSAVDAAYSLERRHAAQLFASEGPAALHRRFWQEPDLAFKMWIVHNEALLRTADTYSDDVTAVSMDALSQGFPLVNHLNSIWDLELTDVPTHRVFDASATQTRTYPMTVTNTDLIERAMAVWRRLRSLEERTALNLEAIHAT